jgi:hypothetical protein
VSRMRHLFARRLLGFGWLRWHWSQRVFDSNLPDLGGGFVATGIFRRPRTGDSALDLTIARFRRRLCYRRLDLHPPVAAVSGSNAWRIRQWVAAFRAVAPVSNGESAGTGLPASFAPIVWLTGYASLPQKSTAFEVRLNEYY